MKKNGWWYLLLAILIPLVFQRAFIAQYVLWDDDALVLNNPILKMPFWEAVKVSFSNYYHGDYFPLTLMSYWLDVQLAGVSAFFQHTENLILHMAATLLLLSCLYKLTKSMTFAVLVSLFFAIHPVQTETVMWISERKSVLSAVFTFLSLLFYLQSQESNQKKWYGLALVFFICAGLTKATALLMPVLFVMLDIAKSGDHLRQWGKRIAPFAVAAMVLMGLRILAYSASIEANPASLLTGVYLLTVPVRALNALDIYFKFLLAPLQSSAIYPDFEMTTATLITAGWMLVVVLLLSFAVYRRKEFLPRFGWVWFLLFLLPVLQIFPRINYVNERYMYLPMIGFVALVCWYFRPKQMLAVGIVCGILMAVLSYARSEMWVSNRALWVQTLKVVPTNTIALNNLGLDYQNAGMLGEAAELYERILRLPSNDGNKILAYNNLANIYADSRYTGFSPAKAIELLKEGIGATKRVRDTYEMRVNLGNLYAALGKKEEAREVLSGALKDLQQESDFKYQWLVPVVTQQLEKLK
ncbi:MAG: tetratricopeptide repeat protein [Bdellovibrionales bacterium]|nr:tetratricopeptide repeat protein [Bdellovibrionales bacterium]